MKHWISMAMIAGMLLSVACAQATSASIPASDPDPTVPASDPDPTVATSDPTAAADPNDLLRQSFERMKSVRSFTANIRADVAANDETFSGNASFALSESGRMAAQIALGEDTTSAGSAASMNWAIRTIDSDLFFKVPLYGWYRVDLDEMDDDHGVPFPGPFDLDAFEELITPDALPWHLMGVTSLGSEEIDGVQTNRIGIAADLGELWQFFRDSDQWERIRTEYGADEHPDPDRADDASMEADLEEMQLSRWELWIDGDGLIRRLEIDVESAEMSASIEIDVDDHDAPITIQPPSEYEDYSAFEGGMFF